MRSYDWRMPEEKYRTVIDHLSDVIYTYFDEYKEQGVREGINPRNIVVIQNLIVDVLDHYYFERKDEYEAYASDSFFADRGLERDRFYLMTCHRRESVESPEPLKAIMDLIGESPWPVYFPASYRTQKRLKDFDRSLPPNVTMVDPIGYRDLLALLVNSRGALTDSGTVVEETAVLGVPSLQIRKATERPQVYDCGSSVKYDPARPEDYPAGRVVRQAGATCTESTSTTGWGTAMPRSGWSTTSWSGCSPTPSGGTSPRTPISTSPGPIREDGLPGRRESRRRRRAGSRWPSLAVVVPVYNEEPGIERSCDGDRRGHEPLSRAGRRHRR